MSGLFGGGGSRPETPKPVRMPVNNNLAAQAAARRATMAASSRGGRSSTFLSDAIRSATGSVGKLGR